MKKKLDACYIIVNTLTGIRLIIIRADPDYKSPVTIFRNIFWLENRFNLYHMDILRTVVVRRMLC